MFMQQATAWPRTFPFNAAELSKPMPCGRTPSADDICQQRNYPCSPTILRISRCRNSHAWASWHRAARRWCGRRVWDFVVVSIVDSHSGHAAVPMYVFKPPCRWPSFFDNANGDRCEHISGDVRFDWNCWVFLLRTMLERHEYGET